MIQLKFCQLLSIIASFCLAATSMQVNADTEQALPTQTSTQAASIRHASSLPSMDRDRLVLMPLRLGVDDNKRQAAMETALVQGLQKKYIVFSGEQVSQKAREIFTKESRNTAHTECDETRCMQNIAEAFQAELIANASVSKEADGYFLALSIRNIFNDKVVFSNSVPCPRCNAYQVVEKLKELSGVGSYDEVDEAALMAARKFKADQIKQNQLDFEEKLHSADAAERKRLIAAKAEDDKRLAEMLAKAEAMRKNNMTQNPTDFPTVESAIAEVDRLNSRINLIIEGYEKELTNARKETTRRYEALINDVDKAKKDDYLSTAEFKNDQEKKLTELKSQRDDQLSRIPTAAALASDEVTPMRKIIEKLTNQAYTLPLNMTELTIGEYDAEEHQFDVSIKTKSPIIQLKMHKYIKMSSGEARLFKQQSDAGLIRPEVKGKTNGDVVDASLVNDADNSRLVLFNLDEDIQRKNQDAAALRQRQYQEELEKEAYRKQTMSSVVPIFAF